MRNSASMAASTALGAVMRTETMRLGTAYSTPSRPSTCALFAPSTRKRSCPASGTAASPDSVKTKAGKKQMSAVEARTAASP
jgi:hypothetical protein